MKSSIVSFIRYQNSALILVMKKNNFGQFLLARIKYLLNKGIVLALVILDRPFGLSTLLGERCTSITEVRGSNCAQVSIFSGLIFYCCLRSVHYCKHHSHIHLLFAVHIYDSSYIHIHSDQGKFSCLKILYIPNLP